MTNETQLIQQGDVLIFTNAKLPDDAQEVQPINGRLILAEGETTGHAHAANVMEYPGTKLFKSAQGLFLSVIAPIEIQHEEHKKVRVPAGVHKIGIVQEVDPFADEVKNVQD